MEIEKCSSTARSAERCESFVSKRRTTTTRPVVRLQSKNSRIFSLLHVYCYTYKGALLFDDTTAVCVRLRCGRSTQQEHIEVGFSCQRLLAHLLTPVRWYHSASFMLPSRYMPASLTTCHTAARVIIAMIHRRGVVLFLISRVLLGGGRVVIVVVGCLRNIGGGGMGRARLLLFTI